MKSEAGRAELGGLRADGRSFRVDGDFVAQGFGVSSFGVSGSRV